MLGSERIDQTTIKIKQNTGKRFILSRPVVGAKRAKFLQEGLFNLFVADCYQNELRCFIGYRRFLEIRIELQHLKKEIR